ncbi:MAG TPA: 4-hydroxy-tetrahydrodipicolinate synthase [Anaeromyxobacter sp.]|nr:4-hydroxy-tetrahydrodipicolinate synthase [Anaeromyxobacter sp.]
MARFEGSMVAVVTPLRNGEVDLPKLRELVRWLLAEGTEAIVPVGTTGEGATLTGPERAEVIRATVEEAAGRVPVIAGAGSNATREAIQSVQLAKELKADAALVVTPYYNKPTQEGLFQHYLAIAEATRFPVVAYNVPSRTAVDLAPDTTARLVKAGAIVGLKDATGNMDRQVQILERVGGEAISLLSGDDATVAPYLACRGHGVISVVANIAPRAMKELVSAARRGEVAGAVDRQVKMADLIRSLFVETSPAPVKGALSLLGRCTAEVRLPLSPLSEAGLSRVREAMVRFGLLAG